MCALPGPKINVGGGSPYQIFQNLELAVAKRLARPEDLTAAGTWTKDALKQARDTCRERWVAMSDDDKARYSDMYRARLAERRAQGHRSQLQQPSDAVAPMGHWGFGAERSVVHPGLVQKALSGGSKLPSQQEVADITEFAVEAPDGDRLLGADIKIDACTHLGRNLCPDNPAFQQIMSIQAAMTTMCNKLGKVATSTGDILLLFEGTPSVLGTSASSMCRAFALLSHVSQSPKYQDFTMVVPDEGQELNEEALPLPLKVSIALSVVPLDVLGEAPATLGLHHETSCDFASALARRAPHWRIRVCKYTLLSPMRMLVTGLEHAEGLDVRCGPRRAARQQTRPGAASELSDVLALNDLGDPFASEGPKRAPLRCPGASGARASGAVAQPQPGVLADAPMRRNARQSEARGLELPGDGNGEEMSADDEDTEAEDLSSLLEAPPPIDVALGHLAEGLLIPDVERADLGDPDLLLEAEGPLTEAFIQPGTTAEGTAQVASPEGLVASGNGPSADEVGQAVDSLEEVLDLAAALADIVPASEIEASGHTSASSGSAPAASSEGVAAEPPVEPPTQPVIAEKPSPLGAPISGGPAGWTMSPAGYVFCENGRHRGRITSWGTNVSAKCALHGCSKAKGRNKITDGQLAAWLARGVSECGFGDGRSKEELKKQHITMFPL